MASLQEWASTDGLNRIVLGIAAGGTSLFAVLVAVSAPTQGLGLVILLVGSFLVVLVHELGHAFAAWAVRWRVWIIHVAPFALSLHTGRVRFVGHYDGPDVGGFVLATPGPKLDTKWRYCLFSAGGPLASWIMAAALIVISINGSGEDGDLRHALYAMGLLSLAGAIASSLPLYWRGQSNDAAHIQWRLDDTLPQMAPPEWGNALWSYGIEPRDWDEATRAAVDRARQTPAFAHIPAFFDFIEAVRNDDPRRARQTFAALSATFNKASIAILDAYLGAVHDGDAQSADNQLARISSLKDVLAEALAFRELTFVEIDRLTGDKSAARERLQRLKRQLPKWRIEKQPIWSDLMIAAYARLS